MAELMQHNFFISKSNNNDAWNNITYVRKFSSFMIRAGFTRRSTIQFFAN